MCGTASDAWSKLKNDVAPDVLPKAGQPVNSSLPVIGQGDTVKTQIGDTGVAAAARKKPRSLLSAAGGGGDMSSAVAGVTYAKPTLGA